MHKKRISLSKPLEYFYMNHSFKRLFQYFLSRHTTSNQALNYCRALEAVTVTFDRQPITPEVQIWCLVNLGNSWPTGFFCSTRCNRLVNVHGCAFLWLLSLRCKLFSYFVIKDGYVIVYLKKIQSLLKVPIVKLTELQCALYKDCDIMLAFIWLLIMILFNV